MLVLVSFSSELNQRPSSLVEQLV